MSHKITVIWLVVVICFSQNSLSKLNAEEISNEIKAVPYTVEEKAQLQKLRQPVKYNFRLPRSSTYQNQSQLDTPLFRQLNLAFSNKYHSYHPPSAEWSRLNLIEHKLRNASIIIEKAADITEKPIAADKDSDSLSMKKYLEDQLRKLPEEIIIPEEFSSDHRFSALEFFNIMEDSTKNELRYDYHRTFFGGIKDSDKKIYLKHRDYKINADIKDFIRPATCLFSTVPADHQNGIPGKLFVKLAWQVDPAVLPLKVNWTADNNELTVNRIEMTAIDQGASYQQNHLINGSLEPEFRYIIPTELKGEPKYLLSGKLDFVMAWGAHQIDLPLETGKNNVEPNQPSTENFKALNTHGSFVVRSWKKTSTHTWELEMIASYPPEILQFNTSDTNLIKPWFTLVKSKTNPSNKKVESTSTTRPTGQESDDQLSGFTTKVLLETVNAASNCCIWKFKFEKAPENDGNDASIFADLSLRAKIPHLLSKETVEYTIEASPK